MPLFRFREHPNGKHSILIDGHEPERSQVRSRKKLEWLACWLGVAWPTIRRVVLEELVNAPSDRESLPGVEAALREMVAETASLRILEDVVRNAIHEGYPLSVEDHGLVADALARLDATRSVAVLRRRMQTDDELTKIAEALSGVPGIGCITLAPRADEHDVYLIQLETHDIQRDRSIAERLYPIKIRYELLPAKPVG